MRRSAVFLVVMCALMATKEVCSNDAGESDPADGGKHEGANSDGKAQAAPPSGTVSAETPATGDAGSPQPTNTHQSALESSSANPDHGKNQAGSQTTIKADDEGKREEAKPTTTTESEKRSQEPQAESQTSTPADDEGKRKETEPTTTTDSEKRSQEPQAGSQTSTPANDEGKRKEAEPITTTDSEGRSQEPQAKLESNKKDISSTKKTSPQTKAESAEPPSTNHADPSKDSSTPKPDEAEKSHQGWSLSNKPAVIGKSSQSLRQSLGSAGSTLMSGASSVYEKKNEIVSGIGLKGRQLAEEVEKMKVRVFSTAGDWAKWRPKGKSNEK